MICTIINQYSGKVKGKREKKGEKVKKTRGEQPVCAAAVAGGAWVVWVRFSRRLPVCAGWLRGGCGGALPRTPLKELFVKSSLRIFQSFFRGGIWFGFVCG